mmetsp:Transcript_89555/g.274200  ORF Transcript_89555/g.274200 Transcript_89555/m.274200 type:complete len:667 (+) Transcript_89555:426-2426(+)
MVPAPCQRHKSLRHSRGVPRGARGPARRARGWPPRERGRERPAPRHAKRSRAGSLPLHVSGAHPDDELRGGHRVPPEGLAQLLVEHDLDQRGLVPLHLPLNGALQRLLELLLRGRLHALEAARLRDLRVLHAVVELRADEVVLVPQRGVPLLGAPLVVPEDNHGDSGPVTAAASRQLVHGNAESAVSGEAHDGRARRADLGAEDRGEAVAARTEEAGGEVLPPGLERRVSVADRAIIADVRRDDGVGGQRLLDDAPGHARRHALGLAGAAALVPGGARVVGLVVHRAELHGPGRLAGLDQRLAVRAVGVARRRGELVQDALSDQARIALDADGDRLGEADARLVDVHLDQLRLRRPIIDAVGGQRGEGVQARPQREDDVGLRDQLHRRLGAVVAEWPSGERVAPGESVVVLVVAAHRRGEPLRQLFRSLDAALREDDASAIEDHRELRRREQLRGGRDGLLAAWRALQVDARGQLHVDDLGPHIPGDVDLRWRAAADGLLDDAIQDLRDARRVTDLLLVADAIFEHGHLLDLLEPALADGLVGGLRRHEQQGRVVPVSRLHRRHEVGDAWAVLRDHHGHVSGDAAVPVGHHAGVALVGAVPELDPRGREQIRDRHHGGADDAERVVDAVLLQNLHESLLRRQARRLRLGGARLRGRHRRRAGRGAR